MKEQDLYFFFNPYTGLVKIGIAGDADLRRRQLEYAGGVRLETLAVFPGQCGYEERLHEAFTESRQVGEWFIPTRDLMGIIEGAETFDALLARYAERIVMYRATAAVEEQERKDRHREEREREKERLASVRAEERRIKREEAERRATAKRRREERETARLAAERERIEAEQALWAAGKPNGLHRPLVAERTAIVRHGNG
jgi:flagellar biosynthesis GTPase FlhF